MRVGHHLTGRDVLALQRRAGRHVSFSVTQACPLRCAHCLVDTVLPHEKPAASIGAADAARYASEFPRLRELGVDRVSFTGGEPLLAIDVVRSLSAAAVSAGMECTVVTAAFWARSDACALDTLRALPDVRHWHLSADRYHQAHVPIEYVVRGAVAALASGRQVVVRMAVPLPVSAEDDAFHDELRRVLPPQVPIATQRVSRVGRAEALDVLVPRARSAPGLCMSTGPLVRSDGSVSPCCSSLADTRAGHPFGYANAASSGVTRAIAQWHADPVLQLARAAGFGPLLQVLRDRMPEHPVLEDRPEHPCDLCVAMWKVPGAAEAVRDWASAPDVRAKVEALRQHVFDEPAGVR